METLNKYWVFDTERFIADYPNNKTALRERLEALAELSETRAMSYDSPTRGGEPGDSTARFAEKSIAIKTDIASLKAIIGAYEEAHSQLTEEEALIIEIFFHREGMTSSKVRYLSNKLNYERSEVYRRRRKAIEHFEELLGV